MSQPKVMKHYIVVAYDIADDERRNKVSDLLSGHGQRVNKSVFELFLSREDINGIKRRIEEEIDAGEDIILYYYLCKDCLGKIERIGTVFQGKRIVTII